MAKKRRSGGETGVRRSNHLTTTTDAPMQFSVTDSSETKPFTFECFRLTMLATKCFTIAINVVVKSLVLFLSVCLSIYGTQLYTHSAVIDDFSSFSHSPSLFRKSLYGYFNPFRSRNNVFVCFFVFCPTA